LADLEAIVRQKLGLRADLPIEVLLRSRTRSKAFSRVPRDLKIDFASSDLVMRPVPQKDPTIRSYAVTCLQGGQIRCAKFPASAGATINDIAPDVCRRWQLSPGVFDFGLCDLDSDTTTLVPMDRKLEDIDADRFNLVVAPKGSFLSTELVGVPTQPAVEINTDDLFSTLNSFVVNFQRMGEDTQFALQFRKTDTIRAAKRIVAMYLGLTGPECVILALKGRALGDAFAMSKVRVANLPIKVLVKATSDRVLVFETSNSDD
jgi:hypothetical protein